MISHGLHRFLPICFVIVIGHSGFSETAPSSFGYVLQSDSLSESKLAAVQKLANCDRDWIILDGRFSGDEPWSKADLKEIRACRPNKKILAYLSIGEAEDYRPYWQAGWMKKGQLTSDAPHWLGKENTEWHGNFRVRYWESDWQNLMLSQVDEIMKEGFDGVYLDIVDGFETFELQNGSYEKNRINPDTKQSFRRDMVDWIKRIAARAREGHATAIVIPQNGSQLLEHSDFLSVINGIGIEDLFTEGEKLQSRSHTKEILEDIRFIKDGMKPVLLVEYPSSAVRIALCKKMAEANGLVLLVTDRELRTIGQSGK